MLANKAQTLFSDSRNDCNDLSTKIRQVVYYTFTLDKHALRLAYELFVETLDAIYGKGFGHYLFIDLTGKVVQANPLAELINSMYPVNEYVGGSETFWHWFCKEINKKKFSDFYEKLEAREHSEHSVNTRASSGAKPCEHSVFNRNVFQTRIVLRSSYTRSRRRCS
jgi:hypothetical protein